MTLAANPKRATIEDWLAAPESDRLELIDGALVPKASPSLNHGRVQAKVVAALGAPFDRRAGGRFPGGWWIATEVDVQLTSGGFRPDVVGWRREHLALLPSERPTTLRPDWVCEILSDSNAATDRIRKVRAYQQAGISHYWLIDPFERTLVVMRWSEGGYVNALVATADETVRAEPFEAIELKVASFFDDEADALP
jgi:Uma2 family endonuclease